MIASTLVEWLKPLFMRFLAFGTQAAATETASHFASQAMKAQQSAAQVGAEGIDAANRLGASGDRHKQRIAELLAAGTVATVELMGEVASGRLSAAQGREALDSLPFSSNSENSETSSAEPKAIEGTKSEVAATNGFNEAEPLKRRGPGRPKKENPSTGLAS